MKSGIELIAQERLEQIEKHGKTVILDIENNTQNQLSKAASFLTIYDIHFMDPKDFCPIGWDIVIWMKMVDAPYIKRLTMAGALCAAQIDFERLSALKKLAGDNKPA